jgi:hypothetical protein
MVQDPSGSAVCGDQLAARGKGSVCIDGHNVTIDGQNNVTFEYAGDQPTILSCACGYRPSPGGQPSCDCRGKQPALFTVRGHDNVLQNFTMKYFSKGIQIQDSSAGTAARNAVIGVVSPAIGEYAVDVQGSGTGHRIEKTTLTADTAVGQNHLCLSEWGCVFNNDCTASHACAGDTYGGTCECLDDTWCEAGGGNINTRCRCPNGYLVGDPKANCSSTAFGTCYFAGRCGGEGIKLEGGSATVGGSSDKANQLNATGVWVAGGTHTVSFNSSNGLRGDTTVPACPTYPASCTADPTPGFGIGCPTHGGFLTTGGSTVFDSNTVEYAGSGIEVQAGSATATANTLRYNYFHGLLVHPFPNNTATLKAEHNRLKENACNTSTWAQSQHPGAMATDASGAVLDAGGGSLGSAGGNSFCEAQSIVDLNEVSGTMTAAANCFDDSGTPTPNVSPAGSVPTSPAYSCTASGFAACSTF